MILTSSTTFSFYFLTSLLFHHPSLIAIDFTTFFDKICNFCTTDRISLILLWDMFSYQLKIFCRYLVLHDHYLATAFHPFHHASVHPTIPLPLHFIYNLCLKELHSRQLGLYSSEETYLAYLTFIRWSQDQDLVISLNNSKISPCVTTCNLGGTMDNQQSIVPHITKLILKFSVPSLKN